MMVDPAGRHLAFKLGKRPARAGAVALRLKNYIDYSQLPVIPSTFGHEALVPGWGMLGNDVAGDCVWAGFAHQVMLWNREASHEVSFSSECVLSDYSAFTGYVPGQPDTDQGTDMAAAAKYFRDTGVVDAGGTRHRVAGYVAIEPGDLQEHYAAMYIFGVVGIGVLFPSSAMDQFSGGQPWDVVEGAQIEGGHYIPLVARRVSPVCITWGRTQVVTERFLSRYEDEAIAFFSEEFIADGRSIDGFDRDALVADWRAITGA